MLLDKVCLVIDTSLLGSNDTAVSGYHFLQNNW